MLDKYLNVDNILNINNSKWEIYFVIFFIISMYNRFDIVLLLYKSIKNYSKTFSYHLKQNNHNNEQFNNNKKNPINS